MLCDLRVDTCESLAKELDAEFDRKQIRDKKAGSREEKPKQHISCYKCRQPV